MGEILVGLTPETFGNIRWNGNNSPTQLITQGKSLFGRKTIDDFINTIDQVHRDIPNI